MLNNTKFVQKVLIQKEGKFLFIKRSITDHSYPGKWDLPGGNVKWGEDLNEALSREVREETSLVSGKAIPKFLMSFKQKDTFVIVCIYQASYESGDINLSPEHSEYIWIPKEEILKTDLQPWMTEMFTKNIEFIHT